MNMKKMNIRLNQKQQKLVEQHYTLAERTVNTFFIDNNGCIAYKYSKEDAFQDARYALCIAAYKYNESNEQKASFKTYAQVVIRNYILRMIKKNQKLKNEVSLDAVMDSEQSNRLLSDDVISMSYNLHDRVLKIIRERKDKVEKEYPFAYEIFLAYHYKGMKISDITEKFLISRRTVYYRMGYAKEDLRKQLNRIAA